MSLLTGLNVYYKFDETTGNASEATGSGLTLTNNNTVTFIPGEINNCAFFTSASSNYFSSAYNSLFNPTSAISFSFWVKTAVSGNITLSLDNLSARDWTVQVRGGGGNIYSELDGASTVGRTGTTVITTGVWHHIAITYDGSSRKYYIDGTQDASSPWADSGTLASGSVALQVGARSADSNFSDGSLDEFGIWSRALTSIEVGQLYNSGAGFQYPFAGATFIKSVQTNQAVNRSNTY